MRRKKDPKTGTKAANFAPMPQRTDTAKVIHAKRAYIELSLSIEEIAELVGRTESTVRRWRKQGQWDLQRAAKHGQAQEIIRRSYEQIERIHAQADADKRPLDKGEADAIVKISAAIKNLTTQVTLHDYVQVMKEFSAFLRRSDSLDTAKLVIEHQEAFLTEKAAQL